MAKVTIRDVAQEAGVGIGTVSRVLNHSTNVADRTREIVWQVIEDLGYVPNAAARQLPRKTPYQSIGVITRPFTEYYSFAERLRGVQTALKPYVERYDLTLHNTHTMHNYDERLLSIIETSVISGLLIIDFNLMDDQKSALYQLGIPFVGLNHVVDKPDWQCIATDNQHGGYLATRHLIDLGHTRIGYIGDELTDRYGFITSNERYTGYLKALDEASLPHPDAYMRTGDFGFDPARELALEMLSQPDHPTAIFAMSDTQALGCINAARQLGFRVPEDISVIGYDDLEFSALTGLTTIRQHLELSGHLAMTYLLQLIHHEAPATTPSLPQLKLIRRESTARCNVTD